ncbi:hypothetical protein [Paenibacillus sp. NRS-1781]|jgi:hypothetical protein|uniref:hypothetical protein n=1 Tax=Paenibacillus sp. NRS-1781 TaxID=3233905 RepID=UPI003D293598
MDSIKELTLRLLTNDSISASAGAALVSLGTDLLASNLDNYNGSRGTTLNLHWLPAPYYTVNSN